MPQIPLRPYWTTPDRETVRLYLGHTTDVLRRLPTGSIQCCVTSPPYWALRDYRTGTWEGGAEGCDHKAPAGGGKVKGSTLVGTGNRDGFSADGQFRDTCGKCGARRVDKQMGLEPTPAEYVANMVAVFAEVWRVMRDDGTLFLNLGDTYDSATGNLVGIPWRVALALQDDGWVLRSDIPWVKRAAMPESVQNRPSKALEYFFLLTKQGTGYFFDKEAIRTSRSFRNSDLWFESISAPHGLVGLGDELVGIDASIQGYSGAHFAVFGENLIEPLIKAGTSEHGACAKCGSPWRRALSTERTPRNDNGGKNFGRANPPCGWENGGTGQHTRGYMDAQTTTTGWEPTCECHGRFITTLENVVVLRRADTGVDPQDRDHSMRRNRHGKDSVTFDPGVEVVEVTESQNVTRYESLVPLNRHPVVPCRVLDPFIGSGTTCAVALRLGLRSWGIDLSETYLRENAIKRIGERLLEMNGAGELVTPGVVSLSL